MYFQKFSCILSVKISGCIKPPHNIQICEIFLNLRIYTVPGLRTENRTIPSGKLRYLYDSRNLHNLLSIVMILIAKKHSRFLRLTLFSRQPFSKPHYIILHINAFPSRHTANLAHTSGSVPFHHKSLPFLFFCQS